MKRVLVIGPAWVGDMVMAQTLFLLLKQRYSDARLEVIAPAWTTPLLSRMPEVDEALSLPLAHGQLKLGKRVQMGCALRQKHYDHAFVLPNSWKSALIPFFAAIPRRTGWLGEMRYGLLNDYRHLDEARYPLMVQRFAALAFDKEAVLPKTLPRPTLETDDEIRQQVILKFNLCLDKPIVALCPGAEFGPSKQWPADYFASVAKEKIKAGWQVWLMGSANDQSQTKKIKAIAQPCVDFAGKTNLAEAIDLLSLATLVISNDSGLMHIAAALDRPLIAIYGSTDPSFTPPLSDRVNIVSLKLPCSPCFKRVCPLNHTNCMKQLSPELVINAVDEVYESITY